MRDDLYLTLGAKIETNVYTNTEFLPNARLAWRPDPTHTIWGAVSRAVRSPSRLDRDLFVPGTPPFTTIAGNTSFRSEVSEVLELGYRSQPAQDVAFSVTVFHHEHDRLRSILPAPGGPILANDLQGHTTGVETWGTYRPTRAWQLSGGLVVLDQSLRVRPGGIDAGGQPSLGNDPGHWWSLRSKFDISASQEFDLYVRRVAARSTPEVPGYTAVDARLGWRLTNSLQLAFVVQNLVDPRHVEWGAAPLRAEQERRAFVQLRWQP